jgi:hypothetical protein
VAALHGAQAAGPGVTGGALFDAAAPGPAAVKQKLEAARLPRAWLCSPQPATRATGEVTVDGRSRTLHCVGGAAYELGTRDRDHGVPLQPFSDGPVVPER